MIRAVLLVSLLALGGCAAEFVDDDGQCSGKCDGLEQSLCDESNVRRSLRSIPGVRYLTSRSCGDALEGLGLQCFRFRIEQPIDHRDVSRGTFSQWGKLVHRSCDAPTVLHITGYASEDDFYVGELSELFEANWLEIEHRYQGRSAPANRLAHLDALTAVNSAGDSWRVTSVLRPFYGGPWISTGGSKGGATVTYERFYYPDFVDATVPYVAPISLARDDLRYREYLEDTVDPQCQAKLRDVQTMLLRDKRAAMMARASALSPPLNEELFEGRASNLDWTFWQRFVSSDCANIPPANADDDSLWHFFEQVSLAQPLQNSRGDLALDFISRHYEWLTEHGFARQWSGHAGSLLELPRPTMEELIRRYLPQLSIPEFDVSTNEAVLDWVEHHAENIFFVYGETDPWSGGAVPAPRRDSAGRYFAADRNHYAYILDLSQADRDELLSKLGQAIGREANYERIESARIQADNLQRIELGAGPLESAALRFE